VNLFPVYTRFTMKRSICLLAALVVSVAVYADAADSKVIYAPDIVEDGQIPHIKNPKGLMIPDKFNTGADPNSNITKVPATEPGTEFVYGYIKFMRGTQSYYGANHLLLDFFRFRDAPSEIVVENTDFSPYTIDFTDYHGVCQSGRRNLIFKNCIFGSFNAARAHSPNMTAEFYDCEFESAHGSYLTFERCIFHPKGGDAMDLFSDVAVKDSYIYINGEGNAGTHMDGFQTFGKAEYDTYNLYFTNLRIEFPKIKVRNVTNPSQWVLPYVNAPVMVQIEFSPYGYLYYLENMHINGGGYSMYWHCVKSCQLLMDSVVKNVQVGYGHMFGIMYPKHENVEDSTNVFDHLEHLTLPYISSAWKSSDGAHVSVTNELLSERIMLCIADGKTNTTHTIPAHPKLSQKMDMADVPVFSDLPYDIDMVVADKDALEVSCYDVTETSELNETNLILTIFYTESAASLSVSVLLLVASLFMVMLF